MPQPDATAVGSRPERALEPMLRFAVRTGLTTDLPPDRYPWTDAFAVCNLLALGRSDLLATSLVPDGYLELTPG